MHTDPSEVAAIERLRELARGVRAAAEPEFKRFIDFARPRDSMTLDHTVIALLRHVLSEPPDTWAPAPTSEMVARPPTGPDDPDWPYIEVSLDLGQTWATSRSYRHGSLWAIVSSTGEHRIADVLYRKFSEATTDDRAAGAPTNTRPEEV